MQDSKKGNQAPSATYRFKNLGPIKEADLELGDLTIIAGHNNTGKTYLAYTLYGFLKIWRSWPAAEALNDKPECVDMGFPPFRKIAQTLIDIGKIRIALDRETLSSQRKYLSHEVAREFSDYAISSIFSSQSDNFDHASIDVDLSGDGWGDDVEFCGAENIVLVRKGNYLDMTRSVKDDAKPDIDKLCSAVSYNYFLSLLVGEFPDPFVLSAERFGISLFYKELDFTKNRLVELLQKLGDDDEGKRISPYLFINELAGRYALPIKDNIDYTRHLSDASKQHSEVYDRKLFDGVKDMMAGYYSSARDDIHFISKARKNGKFKIPIYLASSSARGLSDLYFFLKHSAEKRGILIIDEPESHLDTKNQIVLARLLAKMVRAGMKVLITTHSDYLVKEINNLVMLNSEFDEKNKFLRRYQYDEDDCLSPESIRAYIAEHNRLTPCAVDEFGVDMPVFDQTINSINRAANDLASRLTARAESA